MTEEEKKKKLLISQMNVAFSSFVALSVPALHNKARQLSSEVVTAEEKLIKMKSQMQEHHKVNARAAEIYGSRRDAWVAEEKGLLRRFDTAVDEIMQLKGRISELEEAKAIESNCKEVRDRGEPSLSSEFRTTSQTENSHEAFQLQQAASLLGLKLMPSQTSIGKYSYRDESESEVIPTRQSLESVRNVFKSFQRNLDILFARIRISTRDGASRERNMEPHKATKQAKSIFINCFLCDSCRQATIEPDTIMCEQHREDHT